MSLTPNPSSPVHAHTNTNTIYDDLELTIRFSASLSDLHLSIPGSLYANTATLKQLIRSRLPPQYGTRRIRLIYAGKALIDDVPLQVALQGKGRIGAVGSKVPSRIGTPVAPYGATNGGGLAGGTGQDLGNKGKSPIREATPTPSENRVYIHCSIGDVELSASDLSDEVAIAQRGAEQSEQQGVPLPTLPQHSSSGPANVTTTTPAPRGFDRLHSAGFTSTEITSLRLQFLAIQAHTHTPDTMPSPNTLRNMEDQWLDNSSGAGSASDPSGGADGGLGGGGGMAIDDDGQIGALDDMVWGTVMGFFWPIGCLMWGVREEGIWSQRRKMAVVVGVLLNASLGIIRFTG